MNHTARRLRSESANPHLQAIYPNQKPACFLALLISSKLTYCIGVFLAYDILRQLHVIPLLCLLKLIWHLMNHDKKLFHVCETCGFKFGKKDYYDNHVKYIHPQPSLDYESEEEDYTSIQQINKSMVLDMNPIAMHSGIPSPKKGHGQSRDSLVVELTQPQLQSILEQSESNRIAIVGSDRSVKYLSIAPKNAPQKPSGPQVVSLKALERITNMSTQQIVDLHAPDKNVTDPSQLKAVVIEVAEVEEQQVEEIIVGDGEHFGGSDSSEGAANVEMIEALLDAAETYKAGCLFVIVQKPLTNGQPLTEAQWLQTIYLAVGRVMVSILWFYGISLSGPFRAILVCEQYDFVVVAGFTALTSGAGGNSAFRGALTFLIGLLVLLFLDHDEGNLHPDADHTSSGGSWIGLADHKVGVILMVLVMLVQVGVNSIANKLGSSLGGQKRIHSLTTVFEGIILIPISVFIYAYKGASPDFTLSTYIMPMITSAICIYFLEFYINSFTLQRLQPTQVARVGSISVFLSSLLCAYLWSSAANQVTKADPTSYTVADHSLSGGSIFACILFILASLSLTSDAKQGTKGSFIGYSETGLPLYSFRNSALHQTSKSFVNLCTTIVKQILANQNSRKIFYFLCVNMAFTVVEFVYGVWTNSLGLISDGFHMLFDCSALIMGLVASVMATWKPSRKFSYGYNRVEDLSGFVNGLFLLVISFGVFTEAVSRLFDPPNINTNQLLAVSFAGLCVNLLGILAFRHNPGGSHGHSHGGGHHGHSHNSNMEGVFLHILADTMGSVGVIISSLLIENFGWYIADPICSILISILIFLSVIPLLKNSAYVLLLRVPPKALKEMTTGFKRVQAIDGVIGVKDPYLWQHTSSANIGTLRVQVAPDAVEQRVVQQVTAIFKSMGFTEFTTQVEKPDFPLHLTNLGVNYNSISKIAGHFDNKLLSNPDAVVNVKFV